MERKQMLTRLETMWHHFQSWNMLLQSLCSKWISWEHQGSQAGWIPCGFPAEGKGANVLTSFFSPRPSQSKHTHVKFSSVVWLVLHGLSRLPVLSGFSPEINLLGILFNQELLEERPGYGYDRNQTSSAFPGAERGKNFPSRISSQGITERPRVIEQQQRPEENSEAFFRTFRKACFQSHRSWPWLSPRCLCALREPHAFVPGSAHSGWLL